MTEQPLAPMTLPLKGNIKGCPNGKEMMMGAKIPMTYIGGGPYITRQKGKKVSLGRGAYMSTLEVLSRHFGFKPILKPSSAVRSYIGNVSTVHTSPQCVNVLYCYKGFYMNIGLKETIFSRRGSCFI